ncbi:hypothetical protein SAMN05660330_04451 [Desulforhopalus singaporensis]|uniref:Uncharacterized protein n=1 Tax=Desulforhopalus singaporensis TaxID=91360 RepID=A0A1H0W883_9BACT|nr:hypothetical protein SAMN05660330_04451 [Desulforhopalus singaporensis]
MITRQSIQFKIHLLIQVICQLIYSFSSIDILHKIAMVVSLIAFVCFLSISTDATRNNIHFLECLRRSFKIFVLFMYTCIIVTIPGILYFIFKPVFLSVIKINDITFMNILIITFSVFLPYVMSRSLLQIDSSVAKIIKDSFCCSVKNTYTTATIAVIFILITSATIYIKNRFGLAEEILVNLLLVQIFIIDFLCNKKK